MFSKEDYVKALTLIFSLDANGVSDIKKLRITTLAAIFDMQNKNLQAYNDLAKKVAASKNKA